MGYPTKIMTCCYCGTRAALVLKNSGRHELMCSSCGAPLHDLKRLPVVKAGDRELVRPSAVRSPKPVKSHKSEKKPSKKKKSKKRKSFFKDFLEEAVDFVEDIFD
ncbi:hypothetical protein [Ascidiaceihabitans sp.]|uniref:hypothetical protein n=1 Tax=Ascidiaceihabitans sp. TaxID=1872644 RepID=UPI003299AFAB